MSNVERLRAAVDRLEAVYERQRTEMQQRLPDSVAFEDLRDSTGRPVMLDALVAIVNARTALAAAEHVTLQDQNMGPNRHPGEPWTWLESIAGGHLIRGASGVTLQIARDDVAGHVYVAPLDARPPLGDGWTLAQVTLP